MRLVRMAAWVALLVIGSIAAAGLVVSLDHPASGDARPELTARDAAILAPRLTAITPGLEGMAAAASALSAAGREALVALRAGDADALPAALDDGDRAMTLLGDAARDVRTLAPGLLDGLGEGGGLPATDRERVAAVDAAIAAVDPLGTAWDALGAATLVPAAIVGAVWRHDAAVGAATAAGREERYADAAVALASAVDALTDATAARDRATAAGHATDSLDGLLKRLAARDAALRELYQRLATSGTVRTPEVEAALAAVEATQAALGDPAADLSAAVMDAGGGDVTAALLRIEDGRGAIEAALGGSPAQP